MVSASEATVQGGAIYFGVKKAARIAQIAQENHLPAIHIIESAGADLRINRKFLYLAVQGSEISHSGSRPDYPRFR